MAIRFDESIKEEVRSRADIVAVVSRYVTLKPSGQTMKGCARSQGETPSFHVNPSDSISIVRCGKAAMYSRFCRIEGLDFQEALKMLAGAGANCVSTRLIPIIIEQYHSDFQKECFFIIR
jgi:DNA primase